MTTLKLQTSTCVVAMIVSVKEQPCRSTGKGSEPKQTREWLQEYLMENKG